MSYTPYTEEIDDEKARAIEVLKELTDKLLNRARENRGDWTEEHRKHCLHVVGEICNLQFKIEAL